MTENEFTYWAFLSYSQQDNCGQRPGDAGHPCWGDWLRDELKAFSIPAEFAGEINARGEIIPERIDPIFQDQEEQPGNASLSGEVRQALAQSKCLIVICSPRSAQSLHVNETVRYFKQLGRGNRILPIVVAGEPNAGEGGKPGKSPEDECFVPALRHPVKPDGTLDVSRRERGCIFADARCGDDKREISASDHPNGEIELETARIQLIAGLIGVGFNGLWERELKRRFAEGQIRARAARHPIQEAPAPEVQSMVLEAQNQTREAQQQIHELRKQIQEAEGKVLEARDQAREALGQVAEARNQAQAAEGKFLEAQQLAQEVERQLEAARHQVREEQNKFLEVQNLPQDVKSQLQEAQTKVQEARDQAQNAQSQAGEARQQIAETQNKFLEAQNQVREAQSRVQEMENQARQTQSQLAEARSQAQAAESSVLQAQQQAREAQSQLEAARNEAREAQNKIQEIQIQTRDVQGQIRDAQNKTRSARRLTKIFALLAVLAALAASIALWQRKLATQALARASAAETSEPDLAAGSLNREQIQQALQKIGGTGPDEKQLRRLDELAARIPTNEFSETLSAAAVILDDPQRSHFQEQLLDCWMRTNLPAAFDWSGRLTDADFRQRALEKIIPALAADNLTNALARLNDWKPVPDEPGYVLLFQRWAAIDPVQAIEQRQQVPGQDADEQILSAILAVWMEQQPVAALNWIQSQPDSASFPAGAWRNAIIAGLFDDWAARDLEAATSACRQLPDGTAKEKAWEFILIRRIEQDAASAAELVKNLPAGDYRQKAIEELCSHWVGTNAPTVLDWAQSLPSAAERMTVTNQAVVNWAQSDPSAAAQFADSHRELSAEVFGEIAGAWFQRDLTATTNWIAGLPADEKKEAALLALVEPWTQTDPKGMATFALGLPAGEVQTRYLTEACRQLAMRDLPGTVELLQPLADAALRQSILEQAARSCDLPHVNQAAKYIATLPAGDDQQAAIKGLLSTWTPADPETAVNWLCAFPETNAQPEHVASVIKAWSQTEPAAVAGWLTNSPAGNVSEGTINAFLEGVVGKYPEFAAQWTQSVADETRRQKYQVQVARQWLTTDPSAALKWLDSLNLPEETRRSLKAQSP